LSFFLACFGRRFGPVLKILHGAHRSAHLPPVKIDPPRIVFILAIPAPANVYNRRNGPFGV
jgi:hypothetical protein